MSKVGPALFCFMVSFFCLQAIPKVMACAITEASTPTNVQKNRYRNILPCKFSSVYRKTCMYEVVEYIYTDAPFTYSKRTSVFVENERIQTQRSYFVSDDNTRVILSNKGVDHSDYINANFVKVTPEQLKS